MILSFRWYGPEDPVPLRHIRQIPSMKGIVSALYGPVLGEVWTREELSSLQLSIQSEGLELSVLESIAVHEDIKLGLEGRDRYIDNYCKSLENAGSLGIPVVCYNFMPVFDWMRTDLAKANEDGSSTLSYRHDAVESFDLSKGTGHLPGWSSSYSPEELRRLLELYRDVDEEKLWDNLAYFIEKVIPVASSAGVKLAIHPADPPWSIFGLPRLMRSEAAIRRYLELNSNEVHGITFCSGSLGADPENDLVEIIETHASRIHFVHLRNVKHLAGHKNFDEVAHPGSFGNVDMNKIIKALVVHGYDGPIRPDHGRMIWNEEGKPGYGLYDRALGASYLLGLWEAHSESL